MLWLYRTDISAAFDNTFGTTQAAGFVLYPATNGRVSTSHRLFGVDPVPVDAPHWWARWNGEAYATEGCWFYVGSRAEHCERNDPDDQIWVVEQQHVKDKTCTALQTRFFL